MFLCLYVYCICACNGNNKGVGTHDTWVRLHLLLSSRPLSALRAWLLAEMKLIQCLRSSGNSGHSTCTKSKKRFTQCCTWIKTQSRITGYFFPYEKQMILIFQNPASQNVQIWYSFCFVLNDGKPSVENTTLELNDHSMFHKQNLFI